MNKRGFLTLVLLSACLTISAQSKYDYYLELRDAGLESLKNHKYTDALRQLRGAKFFYDSVEIDQDIKHVNDSIDIAFERARVAYFEGSIESKERAIALFSELLDVMPESYAFVAASYASIGDIVQAKEFFEQGVAVNDERSAFWYARKLREWEPDNSFKRIQLYKRATMFESSKDSLGLEYERLNRIDSAYFWYSASTSAFAKYGRASLLLHSNQSKELDAINDDPYKLLEEAANLGYSQAAYYLGMLYRYRSKTKWDKDNALGWQWIDKAAKMGHSKAKSWIDSKDEYVK